MSSNKDSVIIAAAGSGKTTTLISDALNSTGRRTLLTTYTIENLENIRSGIFQQKGFIPNNVDVVSWYSFLLRHCIRPYQNVLGHDSRIKSVNFESTPNRYTPKDDPAYYVDSGMHIYRDRASDFACQCDENSNGLVISRLQEIYEHIFIDEGQDLCGYDLDLIEKLLDSAIAVKIVADPRQATYSTSRAQRNKKFRGSEISKWFDELATSGMITTIPLVESHRCNQNICDFGDSLYPGLPKTKSLNNKVTGHDGVFSIKKADVPQYVATYNPVILRHDNRVNTLDYTAMNFGASKGRNFDRVLIFPTTPIKDFLANGDTTALEDQSRSKLYVAVTRARYSVAFVVD